MSTSITVVITENMTQDLPYRLRVRKKVFENGSLKSQLHLGGSNFRYLSDCIEIANQFFRDSMKGLPDDPK